MTIGEKIIILRKKENMTQEALSERLQVSRQTLSNWEKDSTTPDINQAKNIAEVFKISLDDLTDNNLEIDCKDNSNNILNNLIGKNCYILLSQNYSEPYVNYNTNVRVLDISNSFIKIEYKKGKDILVKLIDIDMITSIKIIEEENI